MSCTGSKLVIRAENGEGSEAEAAQLLRVALPLLRDLDAEGEEHRLAHERLDAGPSAGAGPGQAAAGLADDDALLAVPLDVEARVDLEEVLVLALDEVVDGDRDRVRQLVGH